MKAKSDGLWLVSYPANRSPGGRSSAQQSRGEFASAVSTARTGHAEVSTREDAAKIQLNSCRGPQPFQSGAPFRHSPGLQTKSSRRVGRVARPRGLVAAWIWSCSAIRRRPAVTLTKPPKVHRHPLRPEALEDFGRGGRGR